MVINAKTSSSTIEWIFINLLLSLPDSFPNLCDQGRILVIWSLTRGRRSRYTDSSPDATEDLPYTKSEERRFNAQMIFVQSEDPQYKTGETSIQICLRSRHPPSGVVWIRNGFASSGVVRSSFHHRSKS
ncbi:hypothetical protein TNCV_4635301 [Trichonephila clavipes]|nr:hypothetical protein TNCV_4635301 [Trichonephila clavipes]